MVLSWFVLVLRTSGLHLEVLLAVVCVLRTSLLIGILLLLRTMGGCSSGLSGLNVGVCSAWVRFTRVDLKQESLHFSR